jgi:hypothetical protein
MVASVRANFLPEQRFIPLQPALQEHLAKIGDAISPANFLSICDEMLLKLLTDTFQRVSADEGSIWLLDERKQHLVIVYNSGPNAAKIVGFKQPLDKGIVSLVVASQRAVIESNVYKNAKYSAALDEKLHSTTYAMIAVPLYFLNQVRGVISCVQLFDVVAQQRKPVPAGKTREGFRLRHFAAVEMAAAIIRDLIDYRLLGTAVGWNRR